MTKAAGLPRSKLTLWAISVIAQTVEDVTHAPVTPHPRLRLALAWLSLALDEKPALDLFWEDARRDLGSGQTDHINQYIRGSHLALRFEGICERAGLNYWRVREHAAAHLAEWPDC